MKGKVLSEPEVDCERVHYTADFQGKVCTVNSSGKQAVKDYLFVRKGQSIEVEGIVQDNTLDVQSARIEIGNLIT